MQLINVVLQGSVLGSLLFDFFIKNHFGCHLMPPISVNILLCISDAAEAFDNMGYCIAE